MIYRCSAATRLVAAPSRFFCSLGPTVRNGETTSRETILKSWSRGCSNKSVAKPADATAMRKDMAAVHVPSGYQRAILVHFKYFPNMESVPERVSLSMMAKAMSQARIKVSLSMIVVALFMCFCTAYYGKTHMNQNSLVEVNLRRHEAYKLGQNASGGRLALVFPNKEPEAEAKKEE